MATTGPTHQGEKAEQVTRELLFSKSSAVSATSEATFGVLSADMALYVRNHIADLAEQISRIGSVGFDWVKFREATSLNDQLAYLVKTTYSHEVLTRTDIVGGVATHVGVGGVTTLDNTNWGSENDLAVREELHNIITTLQKKLLDHKDFSELRILHNSAVNRFCIRPALEIKERVELSSIANAVRSVAVSNRYDILAEAGQLQKESDVQMIMKISEAIAMLVKSGVTIDSSLISQFDKYAEKIKPLKILDNHYKHVTNSLNMVHRMAKNGYPSMIGKGSQIKLLDVLKDLGVTDITKYVLDASKTGELGERTFLDLEFLELKKDPVKLRDALGKNKVSAEEFEGWFMSYFAYMTVEKAKKDLDVQKALTFGENLKHYERDVNVWRGHARERIFEAHGRMVGIPPAFNPVDADMMSSYFDKFKDIFYASDEDEAHYEQIREVLAAIVRARVPMLRTSGNRFSRGFRRTLKRMNNPGINARLRRMRRQHLDDSEFVAMIIMAQNESSNMMFYRDSDPFADSRGRKTRMKKLSKVVSQAEEGREAVEKVISKPANVVFSFAEHSLREGANLTNKVISNAGRLVTSIPEAFFGKISRMIETKEARATGGKDRGKISRWRAMLLPFYGVSSAIEKGAGAGNKLFNYTNDHGSEMMGKARKSVIGIMQKGLNDEKVDSIYKGFFGAFKGLAQFLTKPTSFLGQANYDRINTAQQRNVLASFVEAAAHEDDLAELMESCDLANMLNLKESGPQLFNDDGRVMSIDQFKAPDKNTPEGAGKEMSEALKNQLDTLIKQAEDEYRKANTDLSNARRGTDEKKKVDADIDFAHSGEVKNDVRSLQGSIIKLVPLLKAPVPVGGVRRKGEIDSVLDEVDIKLINTTGGALGMIDRLNREIGIPAVGTRAATGLNKDLQDAHNDFIQHNTDVKTTTGTIQTLQEAMRSPRANLRMLESQIARKQGELTTQTLAKINAEQIYQQKSRELTNKKQHLSYLLIVQQRIKDIRQVSNDMHAAMTHVPPQPTADISEKLIDLTKNMNLLLVPEEKKDVEDSGKIRKIKEILKNIALTDDVKTQLIEALAA